MDVEVIDCGGGGGGGPSREARLELRREIILILLPHLGSLDTRRCVTNLDKCAQVLVITALFRLHLVCPVFLVPMLERLVAVTRLCRRNGVNGMVAPVNPSSGFPFIVGRAHNYLGAGGRVT